MELLEKTWYCADRLAHNVIQVVFDDTDIKQAAWIADQKLQYVNVHSPGGIVTLRNIIRSRIISGKLADHCVKQFLNSTISSRGLALAIQEYDEIRTDNWKNHDFFDLQITSSLSQRDIEVRSSFSYILAQPERIIQRLSIYGWYVSGNKPIEPPRNFYWQVIYHLRPRDIRKEPSWPDLPIFEDQLEFGKLYAYIVGGATKDMLSNNQLAVIRRDQDRAFYQSISPICLGMDAHEILNATLT